ncbi:MULTISPECIES: HD domain-containing protein [Curtobacterium]|jgi:(p)ppGpp synthase/HD superfamily hydrolase|uniref:HD domain-containing protein n=2 Tax=Curtobacterium TaxID=2034 RepID=A0A6G7GBU6_9MICO|nr:HD domain-containing protein [Curtobacterium flaccumfaciens]MBO9041445.1 HD domain-containing protein [Curtobacterium flaccumfaciens pv. flaccumfaciens]MBO9044931.1 HD domain-containing protein [Curtobacterium flaccumfaciens pv. flaccumfaciens]MBO9048926.1 HD domain-containing protein [Curtobacterium flaccumfaciens pv. flaccumfaciens]MBO9057777.1 HD domain-containing protein [Curtobacterium flaccumfaciens pv. flaccumfaciens]MBT1543216.1 HD domain-containing protein [Curtobacterium flaccumfa
MRQEQLIAVALTIAREAHAGQVDKAGRAYIEHPVRVAKRVRRRNPDASAGVVAAALLHDVLEDTELTRADLLDRGIPVDVVDDVDAVTKRAGESPEEYFARVRARAGARAVKGADIEDNTDPERLAQLDEPTRRRLLAKYERSQQLLEGE